MRFTPGQPANRTGRPRGQTIAVVRRDVRKVVARAIAPHAEALVAQGVERALAGNAESLAGCLSLIAALAGDQAPPPPAASPAAEPSSLTARRGAVAASDGEQRR